MAAEKFLRRAGAASSLALLLGLAGCGSPDPARPDAAVDDRPTTDLGPAIAPQGLRPQGDGPLFSLDTTQPVITLAIEGDAQHLLQGVLTDAQGRRELRYVGADGRAEVIAPAGWNLPPAAAVVRGGDTMACFNVLLGPPSSNTAGEMPDPSLGVTLRCRLRTAQGWGAPSDLATVTRGAWVQRVVAREDGGFRVLIYGDDGWLIAPPTAQHGIYDATFAEGRWSPVRFVMPAPQE